MLRLFNASVVPARLEQSSGRFEGALPMVGFGAGAWLLGLNAAPAEFCAPPSSTPRADAAVDASADAAMDAAFDASADVAVDPSADAALPDRDALVPATDAMASRDGLPPAQDAGRVDVDATRDRDSGASGRGATGGCATRPAGTSTQAGVAILGLTCAFAATRRRRAHGRR
jgi:hypothetical protein